jgi:hypothetical protein
MITETPQQAVRQAARQAIEWHKQQEARGESPWSCRLFDGQDGPNAGKQAPPPRQEWWASHPAGARGNVPPRHRTGPIAGRETALPDKKAKRKAEKLARRKQR